jgi:uncharacterized protein (TIGR02271 family)
MHSIEAGTVQDQDGVRGTVIPAASPPSHSTTQVTVQLENGERVQVPVEALRQQSDGTYYVPLRLAELGSTDHKHSAASDAPLVVPVIAEELDVQKQVVETGKVRITKVVHEREVLVDEPLWHDRVDVTRVPIHRVVDGPIPIRYEDDTMIVSILEEEVVVEKRLVLKEELHIRTRRTETHQPQHLTLRSEEARIERLNQTQQ